MVIDEKKWHDLISLFDQSILQYKTTRSWLEIQNCNAGAIEYLVKDDMIRMIAIDLVQKGGFIKEIKDIASMSINYECKFVLIDFEKLFKTISSIMEGSK